MFFRVVYAHEVAGVCVSLVGCVCVSDECVHVARDVAPRAESVSKVFGWFLSLDFRVCYERIVTNVTVSDASQGFTFYHAFGIQFTKS